MEDAQPVYAANKEVIYENTFITEPEGYGEGAKFQRHKVQAVLKQVLKERMEKQKYDPVKGAQIAKQLADDLREKVKLLGYDRYKLVIQVSEAGEHKSRRPGHGGAEGSLSPAPSPLPLRACATRQFSRYHVMSRESADGAVQRGRGCAVQASAPHLPSLLPPCESAQRRTSSDSQGR